MKTVSFIVVMLTLTWVGVNLNKQAGKPTEVEQPTQIEFQVCTPDTTYCDTLKFDAPRNSPQEYVDSVKRVMQLQWLASRL